jgi:hypothetical protein
MQYYATEALKAINICEEKNMKIMTKIMSKTEEIMFPLIIDERNVPNNAV